MIFNHIEFHNVCELLPAPEGSGMGWLRVPENVFRSLESGRQGTDMAQGTTGVELRFVMEEDEIKLRLRKGQGDRSVTAFRVFHGGIQGSWEEHELDYCLTEEVQEFTVKKPSDREWLRRVSERARSGFSPDVVRVIFDRGRAYFDGVIGKVRPPEQSELPQKTLLCYGSSVTHGSNSIDASHSWASLTAHALKTDLRNLGMAGSCFLEPSFADYLGDEGARGAWDIATLELGINVLGWEKEKISERVKYLLRQTAGRNADKSVYVISPLYCEDDFYGKGNAQKWRDLLSRAVAEGNFPNAVYIDGLDLIDGGEDLSADKVHPNIYGCQKIAERLTKIIMQRERNRGRELF